MNSAQIQQLIYDWAIDQSFTAPYGVLSGSHVNRGGKRFLSVTFGRARTLDVTVEIYNRNFMIVRTNRHGSTVYNNLPELQQFLNTL